MECVIALAAVELGVTWLMVAERGKACIRNSILKTVATPN
jgi:hypothetical protein